MACNPFDKRPKRCYKKYVEISIFIIFIEQICGFKRSCQTDRDNGSETLLFLIL